MADGPNTTPAETYLILSGVRRALSARFLGYATVPAEERDRLGAKWLRTFDVPVSSLLSPKAAVELDTQRRRDHWFGVYHKMRDSPGTMPPIVVVRSSRGTPISAVTFDLGTSP